MLKIASLLIVCIAAAVPAHAQSSPLYGGVTAGSDGGRRGPVDLGSFPTVGGAVGVRFANAWSIELLIDRGFGRSADRVFEGLLQVQTNVPISSEEERQRKGIFGRTVENSKAGIGYSAQIVWRSRAPGRVNAAFYGGISWRRFERHYTKTITAVGPEVTYSPAHLALQNVDHRRPTTGGGLTAGVMLPIHLADRLTVAPDVRMTFGLITDESTYEVVQAGVRLVWGF